ncbi:phosphotriesterase family protein [Streptosporangium sp. NPDC002607]
MRSAEPETVRGRVRVDELKTVPMHEHVFVTTPEIRLNYPHLWQEDERIAGAVSRRSALKQAGVHVTHIHAGVTDHQIDVMLIDNPRRYFSPGATT